MKYRSIAKQSGKKRRRKKNGVILWKMLVEKTTIFIEIMRFHGNQSIRNQLLYLKPHDRWQPELKFACIFHFFLTFFFLFFFCCVQFGSFSYFAWMTHGCLHLPTYIIKKKKSKIKFNQTFLSVCGRWLSKTTTAAAVIATMVHISLAIWSYDTTVYTLYACHVFQYEY